MPVSNLRTIVVNPAAYKTYAATNGLGPISSTRPSTPYMQSVTINEDDPQYTFFFPFPVNQISYGSMSPEMSEVQRPGKKPLVLFSRRRSQRINLQFLVARPDDGMFFDIEHGLNTLHQMAELARPIRFFRVDSFLGTTALAERTATLTEQPLRISSKQWVIMDMNFDSIRRNARQRITAANVTMSLVEGTFPKLEIFEMAPIVYQPEVTRPPTPGNRPDEPEEEDPPNYVDYTDVDGRTGDYYLWD